MSYTDKRLIKKKRRKEKKINSFQNKNSMRMISLNMMQSMLVVKSRLVQIFFWTFTSFTVFTFHLCII